MLLLDALNPPRPAQLVADCRDAGADGCWVYAARFDAAGDDIGIGTWSRAHVDALRAAGLVTPAIIVPGDAPPAPGPLLDAVDALACDLQVAYDLETFSLAPPAWLARAIAETRARGRRPLRYGDVGVLATYPAADGDWISHGAGLLVRAGVLQPVPPVPAGTVADQYVVRLVVNGNNYDGSTADPAVFTGGLNVAQLDNIENMLTVMYYGDPVAHPDCSTSQLKQGQGRIEGALSAEGTDLTAARTTLGALKAEVDTLQAAAGGTVDLGGLYARLDALSKHLGAGVP
jgi:hypothetical protein